MRINWLELRNKKTGMTLKKVQFNTVNCLSGESSEAISFIFDAVLGTSQFAQGKTLPGFLDVICRINFNANHREYLWYAKNSAGEQGETIVDEEELYDSDNQMLLRRSFQELSFAGFGELPAINLEKSMLYLFNSSEIPALITSAFSHISYHYPQPEQASALLDELKTLPHGMLVLLDGRALSQPLDLSPLVTARNDLQIIAANCTAADTVPLQVTLKGKMIGCK